MLRVPVMPQSSTPPARHVPVLTGDWRVMVVALLAGLACSLALVLSGPNRIVVPLGAEAADIAPARLLGVHASERQYDRRVRWTDGLARLRWPAVIGLHPAAVEITLASFPGRAGDQVRVTVNQGDTTRHTMSGDWDTLRVPVTDTQADLTLEVTSLTHVAPGDARRLGVRLHSLALVNASWTTILGATPWWHIALLTLVGALTVTLGARLTGHLIGGLVACAGLGMGLWATRLTTLHAASARAAVATLCLAGVTGFVLTRGGVGWRTACVVAVCSTLPFLVLATVIPQHFVPVPRWDVWDLVPLIEESYAGTLSVADLWRSHNAHRPFTGRTLLLANVWLTRWNHWVDLALLLATAALQFLVIVAFVARTRRHAARVHPASLVVVALFVFTLVQWENWLQGWQVVLLVGALAVSAALFVLTDCRVTWSRTIGAGLLGLMATASFLSCLLVWPLGALAIVARRANGWRPQLLQWSALTVVTIAVYAWDLPPDPSSRNMAVFATWDGLRALVGGILVSVGTPALYAPGVFMGETGALEWGIVVTGGAAMAVATGLTMRHAIDARGGHPTWLFPALLCLFGVGAGALAALGRAWLGLQAMTASRYVVFGAYVWIGLALLLAMSRAGGHRSARIVRLAALSAIAVLAALNWRPAMPHVEAHYLSSSQARAWLLRGDVHAAASVLFPDPFLLEERAAVLRQHRLSLFRPGAPP